MGVWERKGVWGLVCNGREEREREAEKHWRREREKMGEKNKVNLVTVIN